MHSDYQGDANDRNLIGGSATRGSRPAPDDDWLARLRSRVSLTSPQDAIWLLPLALAAAYAVLFVLRFSHNVAGLGFEAQVGSAYLIPQTLDKTGTGGATVLASAGQWVPLWFGLLTATLPLHRELWDVTPTALFLLSALTVGWSVAQLAGRRAAALAVLIAVIASPLALAFFMAPFSHNTIYPCTTLLGAYLIWLARGHRRRKVTAFAVPPLAGIVIGTCLASDALLTATAVIPLGLTALLALVRRDRRSRLVGVSALTTVAVAVPVAKATTAIMKSAGYITLPTPIKVAPLAELSARAQLLFKGLQKLFNGYLGTETPGSFHAALGLAADIAMSAALLALLVAGIAALLKFTWSGLRDGRGQTPAELERSLHMTYWVIAAVSACGAFWIAGEGPVTTHESYYATVIFAVAAVIPLLLARALALRVAVALGTSILFGAGLVGLADNYVAQTSKLQHTAAVVEKFAVANHVSIGYTNWGDASGITWGLHERVILRPLSQCEDEERPALCPGFQALVPSWYVPQQRRSLLLIDAEGIELRTLPPGLGKPIAAYESGVLQLYVYPYDIASRLERPL
jgi:hypothetical protein